MSEVPLPRRERDRRRHRQEILDAARRLVAGKGIECVTIEEIARASDFAVGSIYRHFRSKEELLELLICDLASPFVDEVEALAQDPRPFFERFDAYMDAFSELAREHEPLWQLFLVSPGGLPIPGTEAGDHLKEASTRYFAAAKALVASGQREGCLVDEDPAAMAQALIGLMGTFSRASAFGRVDLATGLATARRIFLDGSRTRG